MVANDGGNAPARHTQPPTSTSNDELLPLIIHMLGGLQLNPNMNFCFSC